MTRGMLYLTLHTTVYSIPIIISILSSHLFCIYFLYIFFVYIFCIYFCIYFLYYFESWWDMALYIYIYITMHLPCRATICDLLLLLTVLTLQHACRTRSSVSSEGRSTCYYSVTVSLSLIIKMVVYSKCSEWKDV